MRIGSLVWVALGFAALPACGSEDAESFCEQYCARVRECSQASDGSCPSACANYEASTPLSSEFLLATTPCMARSSCADVLSGDYWQACSDEASAGVEPSAALVESCSEIASNEFQCGWDTDLGLCVDNLKIYKQAFIGDVLACSREDSCELVAACYERVFA